MIVDVKRAMAVKLVTEFSLILVLITVAPARGQDTPADQSTSVPLTVGSGVPLRLYLTKRVPKQINAPVEAKLLTPLYAFDREVLPTGTQVLGHVIRLRPVPAWERARAILGGDFTPLHIAEIEFTSLVLPSGQRMDIHTVESPGLNSVFPLKPPKQPSTNAQGKSGIKQKAKDQIDAQVARVKGIPELVRGTDLKELVFDYAMSRLPYHPQSVRNRTRFDAELNAPLNFGSASVPQKELELLGSQPEAGNAVHARLVTPLDSAHSKAGENVEGVLEQPVFSADHRLVLPEGTFVRGSVGMARKAGWFHRAGRLRFTFQSVDLAPEAAVLKLAPGPTLQFRSRATLTGAEGGNGPVKVGSEGGVQTKDSKTRFIGTAIALLITRRAADNDAERAHNGTPRKNSNVAGRTLGGGLGLGMLGSIAAQSSRNVGAILGYYGMAWSVFSTVVARGPEVQFGRNAAIDIDFNQRAAAK